ncbi:hypothetical protein ACVWW1_003777 [Bradyrhizobium sp. JR3.5]
MTANKKCARPAPGAFFFPRQVPVIARVSRHYSPFARGIIQVEYVCQTPSPWLR